MDAREALVDFFFNNTRWIDTLWSLGYTVKIVGKDLNDILDAATKKTELMNTCTIVIVVEFEGETVNPFLIPNIAHSAIPASIMGGCKSVPLSATGIEVLEMLEHDTAIVIALENLFLGGVLSFDKYMFVCTRLPMSYDSKTAVMKIPYAFITSETLGIQSMFMRITKFEITNEEENWYDSLQVIKQ